MEYVEDVKINGENIVGTIVCNFSVKVDENATESHNVELTCKLDNAVTDLIRPALKSRIIDVQGIFRRAAKGSKTKAPEILKKITVDLVPNVSRESAKMEYIPVSEYRSRHKELATMSDEVLIFIVNEQTKPKGWRLVAG